jgi:hypothetical protein
MGIKLSDLPPELRARVLEAAGPGSDPAALPRRKPRAEPRQVRLGRICSCLFEMFRPDGVYPDHCDGCGRPWPE